MALRQAHDRNEQLSQLVAVGRDAELVEQGLDPGVQVWVAGTAGPHLGGGASGSAPAPPESPGPARPGAQEGQVAMKRVASQLVLYLTPTWPPSLRWTAGAASLPTNHRTRPARTRVAGTSSPATTASMALRRSSPSTVKMANLARAIPA